MLNFFFLLLLFSGWCGSQVRWQGWLAGEKALLLCVEGSLGIWLPRHLVWMPPGCLPGKVFQAFTAREETSWQTQDTLEDLADLEMPQSAPRRAVGSGRRWGLGFLTKDTVPASDKRESLRYKDLGKKKLQKRKNYKFRWFSFFFLTNLLYI